MWSYQPARTVWKFLEYPSGAILRDLALGPDPAGVEYQGKFQRDPASPGHLSIAGKLSVRIRKSTEVDGKP